MSFSSWSASGPSAVSAAPCEGNAIVEHIIYKQLADACHIAFCLRWQDKSIAPTDCVARGKTAQANDSGREQQQHHHMVQLKKEANLARAEWTEACKHKLERCIEQREEDQQDYRHLFPSSRSQIAAHVEHTRCPHANARANEASRMPQSV